MIMIDIDMPNNCDECQFSTEYGFCKAMPENFCGNTDSRKRPEWCPMKEQEAVIVESIQMDRSDKWGADLTGYCPSCKRPLKSRFNQRFCGECGQAVKWD